MIATSTRSFRRGIAIAVLPALLFVGSCSKETPLCEDAQSLKDSIQGLTQVDFESGGADALQAAVDDVNASIDALGDEAKNTFGAQITAIQTQLTALSSIVDDVNGGEPVTEAAPTVVASISALGTAVSDLRTTAQSQDCDLE
jgi:hypothetical protein